MLHAHTRQSDVCSDHMSLATGQPLRSSTAAITVARISEKLCKEIALANRNAQPRQSQNGAAFSFAFMLRACLTVKKCSRFSTGERAA